MRYALQTDNDGLVPLLGNRADTLMGDELIALSSVTTDDDGQDVTVLTLVESVTPSQALAHAELQAEHPAAELVQAWWQSIVAGEAITLTGDDSQYDNYVRLLRARHEGDELAATDELAVRIRDYVDTVLS